MSNQVRELVTKSIHNYVEFFRQFKKDRYPTPQEIVTRDYDPDSDFEYTFVTLSLHIKDDNIEFVDDIPELGKKLKQIVP